MIVRKVSVAVVVAVLAVAVGATGGAEATTADRVSEVTVVVDAGPVTVQQSPGEIIAALDKIFIAYARLGLGEGLMNMAIAAGSSWLWLWQIGNNVWDTA